MKWVQINRAHFNADLICSFHYNHTKRMLYVWFVGDHSPEGYDDPDKENYLRLCRALGVAPIEEGHYGQS